MEIIELKSNEVIRCNGELVKITIGDCEGNWTNEDYTTTLESGEICLSDEAIPVGSNEEYYHEDEFEEKGIVYDHYRERYEFEENCLFGYIDGNREDGHFHRDAEYREYNGIFYIHDGIAELYGIYHCSDCDTTYNGNYDNCNCSDEDNWCFSYHSENREDFSKGSVYKIGFEIEKEDEDQKEYEYARDLFNSAGWAKEVDGSLNSSGFELVSPILPLDLIKSVYIQEDLTHSIDEVKHYINADYSKRCGGHINVSCNGLSSFDILLKFKGYIPLFYAIYQSRIENTYCTAKKFNLYVTETEKYHAFHCKNNDVLEIRIFPAVKDVPNLLWRAELIRLILANPTESYKKALEHIANPKNELHKHLCRVFSKSQLLNKTQLFVDYAKDFESFEFDQKVINRYLRIVFQAA
ncbi:MAG: hypothetical protein KBD25_00860 [Rickettsiaceae bacterium]|nr:hypothetical protein [Rickettsiaceae bacterium]